MPARVIIIDDHAILRDGLRAILETEFDLQVVGEAGTIAAGLLLALKMQPDIAISDLMFPTGNGLDGVSALRHACPGACIVVLTIHESEECMNAALEAGADDFVPKSAPSPVLLRALRGSAVLRARRPGVGASEYSGETNAPSAIAALTFRERQVLIGIAQGYSSRQIAAKLRRSGKTIEKHRSTMMRKLSLHDATAVTRFAIAHGLLSVTRDVSGDS